MPLTRIDRGYLLVADENLTARMKLKAMLQRNPFEAIPEIRGHLLPANINCIFIVSQTSTTVLAEKLRKAFPGVVFILAPIHEVDGFLPEAAWVAIHAAQEGSSSAPSNKPGE